VLFSGTPCQIAGLKRFLRKDYPNLIAVDIICHGVPSPLVWRKYVSTLLQFKDADAERATDSCAPKNVTHRTDIQFRDKRLGWANFGFSVRYAPSNDCAQSKKLIHDIFEPFEKNIYMKGFLRNLYLRPSCASCPSKSGKSGADITLADFWGVSRHYPELYDKDGVSLVIVASERGQFVIDALNIRKSPVEYKKAIEGNSPYEHSVIFSPTRHIFWKFFPKYGIFAVEKALKAARPSVATRVISRLKRLIIS
jgi:hypothetical protein